MRRILKISAYSIGFILILVCCACFLLPVILKKNGITYTDKNFDFPCTLKLDGLNIIRPNLTASIQEVEINLSINDLLNGTISGEYLSIKNGNIHYTVIQNDEPYDSNFLKNIYPINFKKVMVSDIAFRNIDKLDTLLISVQELLIKNVDLRKVWHVDSFSNTGMQLQWITHYDTIKNKTDVLSAQRSFSISDIPELTIQNLRFNDCKFDFLTNSNKQSFSKINIEMNRQKENESFAMAFNKFSLRYQDSFDLDLSLNKILINNRQEAHLTNLAFNFPWLKLDIQQLDLSNNGTPEAKFLFKNSSINTAFVKRFVPQLKLPFAYETEVRFAGAITINKEMATFNKTTFSLADNTSFMLDGFTTFSAKQTPSLQLKIAGLQTSSADLEKLFDFKHPADVKEIKIRSVMMLSGTYESMNLDGSIELNGIKSQLDASIEQKDKSRMVIAYKLQTGLLDPGRLYDLKGTSLKLTNLIISGKSGFIDNKITNTDMKLSSDSINTETYCFKHPNAQIKYTPKAIDAELKLADLFKVHLHSADNILSNHISYKGSVESIIPQFSDMDSSAGDFDATFNGIYTKSNAATDFKLVLETIRFKPTVSEKVYVTNGFLTAGQKSNGDLHLNLSMKDKEIVRFNTTDKLSDWWSSDHKWEGNYPTSDLAIAIDLDSLLMLQLTGQSGILKLNNLEVHASGNDAKGTIDLPALLINDYDLREVKGNFASDNGHLNGLFNAALFKNPFTKLKALKIEAVQTDKNTIGLSFSTHLPDIKDSLELHALISHDDSSYLINLDENDSKLGNNLWQNKGSKGFTFNNNFKLLSGDLHIVNGKQSIGVETNADKMTVSIDSLNLEPIVRFATNDSFFHGNLNLNADYYLKDQAMNWSGNFSQVKINKKAMGTLHFEGLYNKQGFNTHFAMNEDLGKLDLLIQKTTSPITYRLTLDSLDLTYLNSGTPWASAIPVTGEINAKVAGTYNGELTSDGYLAFKNVESYLTENKIYLKTKTDTLWFKNANLMARNFKIYDRLDNVLSLDGTLTLSSDPKLDIKAVTKSFRLLDPVGKGKSIKGTMDIASNLRIIGDHDRYEISGVLDILPDSKASYLYESSVSIDERESEMTFVAFDKLDSKNQDTLAGLNKAKSSKPLEWDVRLTIDKFNATVLLSETYQDNIKMNTSGIIQLKTGISDVPNFYGTLKSNEGSVVYDVPMVSNVDLKIEYMLINWNGDIFEPRITFLGTEIFRVSSQDIPGMSNTGGIIPISVIVKVNDRSAKDIDITFDLNSSNTRVKSWIESLPEDTRQANALNLLLFGRLTFGESESNLSLVQGLATKMNELSRRNFQSANLTFYAEKQDLSGKTLTTSDKLGYNYSKGFFGNTVKVSVGGTLDLNNTSVNNAKQSTNQSSVQLDYIISTTPEIVVMTSQKTVYDGAINGEIAKTTVGISYLKRYRNLFKPRHRKAKK